jgi:N-acetylglucosaminyldiphosphoundecaprenol N-acetyl-beta-D-mannosaminyltransferase
MAKQGRNLFLIKSVELEKILILGIPVHRITMQEALLQIEKFIRSKKSHLVITLGTEMVVAARKNHELQRLIHSASLVVPDGGGLLWASRRLGKPLPEKVAGIELVEKLCALSGEKNWKLFFLGGKPGIAEKTVLHLKEKFPNLNVAGFYHGYFKDEEVLPLLQSAKPDILFAGLGFPKQEQWLSKHLEALQIPVGIGVGGSFDVLSGNLKRAPAFFLRLNLEWLFRFLQEPRRFKRILSIPLFMLLIWKEKLCKPNGGTT